MSKRIKRLAIDISLFLRQYARKARKGLDPNDRTYSREIEGIVKRMSPVQLDAIQRGEHEWPFTGPQNTAVFTTKDILNRSKPILQVTHDLDDGAWQFLPGEPVSEEQAKIVALREIAILDPTILELADLREGWCAERDDADQTLATTQEC